jgi:hypothetical protein
MPCSLMGRRQARMLPTRKGMRGGWHRRASLYVCEQGVGKSKPMWVLRCKESSIYEAIPKTSTQILQIDVPITRFPIQWQLEQNNILPSPLSKQPKAQSLHIFNRRILGSLFYESKQVTPKPKAI